MMFLFGKMKMTMWMVVVVLGGTEIFHFTTTVDSFIVSTSPSQSLHHHHHRLPSPASWKNANTWQTNNHHHQVSTVMTMMTFDPNSMATAAAAAVASSSILSSAVDNLPIASSATSMTTTNMDPLLTYLLQTLITNGVPALFSIIVFGFIAWQIRSVTSSANGSRNNGNNNPNTSNLSLLYDDFYGDQDQDPFKRNNPSAFGMLGGGNNRARFPMELPKNTGVPKLQYIQVTHLNPKYDSYQYSINAQTQSKAMAAATYRQAAWQRAWGKALLSSSTSSGEDDTSESSSSSLTPFQIQSLMQLEQEFLQNASAKQQEIQTIMTALQRKNMDETMKKMGMESVYQIDPNNTNVTTKVLPSGGSLRKWKGGERENQKVSTFALATLQTDLVQLEMKFMDRVLQTVGPKYAATIRTIVLGSETGEGLTSYLLSSSSANTERPLTRLLSSAGPSNGDGTNDVRPSTKKKIFVTRFPGDLNASQVATLREEITAILQSKPRPNMDEVIVVLQTGGGTVTGYGLAAAQLQRIKNANIHLTIAVEQVAASGGYMMACIADTIVASPFAVLGSIGVISDVPNVYERLKEEGIEFQTITAGKYKRTITPTKKVTKEDFQKSKEDIEEIFGLFRDFVKENRPKLDIDKVATGETWFGTAALEKKLCDAIQTVDDLLLSKINNGDDVYEVAYKPPLAINDSVLGRLLQPASSTTADGGPIRSMVRWMVQSVFSEVQAELLSSSTGNPLRQPVENRYMAVDETSDRVRSQIE